MSNLHGGSGADVCVFVFVQIGGEPGALTMVQKYQSPVRVYKQPFELVMAVSLTFFLFPLCANVRAQLCNFQSRRVDFNIHTYIRGRRRRRVFSLRNCAGLVYTLSWSRVAFRIGGSSSSVVRNHSYSSCDVCVYFLFFVVHGRFPGSLAWTERNLLYFNVPTSRRSFLLCVCPLFSCFHTLVSFSTADSSSTFPDCVSEV